MQRLRTAIKKMAAIGAGIAMTGATMMGALAASTNDLGMYPAPFVDKGKFSSNTAIVVGEQAAASDTLGSVDIARQLQYDSKICVPSTGKNYGGGVVVAGDSFSIGDGKNMLELEEDLGQVKESITELELNGLKGGVVTTTSGTTQFNQYLRFREFNATGTNTLGNAPVVNFTTDDAPIKEVGDWLYVKEGTSANQAFFEYELEFEDGLKSKISSAKLDDYTDEEIVMLGTTYTFVDTSINTAAASTNVRLDLLGGSVFDILEEGEEKTYNIKGKEYKVNVMIIEDATPASVVFNINGEVTKQLTKGETEILKDGTLIGISNIILNEAGEAGSGDIVELYIGATKVTFTDNYSDSESSDATTLGYSQTVEIDERAITAAFVQIKGAISSTASDRFQISSLRYRLVADALPGYRDIWVPPGHGVREYLNEPQGMLGTTWDIRYEGLDDVAVSMIKLEPRSQDKYTLEFENRQGTVYKFPYISNQGGTFKYGENDKDLVFVEANFTEGNNFTQAAGNNAWPDGSGGLGTGEALQLNWTEFNIGLLDYFVLSDAHKNLNTIPAELYYFTSSNRTEQQRYGGLDNTATTHIVRYSSIDTTNRILTFDEQGSGSKKFTYETLEDSASGITLGKARLVFGGNTFLAYVANATEGASDNPLAIDMNSDGQIDRTEIRLTTNGGAIIDLGDSVYSDGGTYNYGDAPTWSNTGENLGSQNQGGQVFFNLTTLSEDFDQSAPHTVGTITTATNENFAFGIYNSTGSSNNRVGLNLSAFSRNVEVPDNDDHNKWTMTDYGAKVHVFDPASIDQPATLDIAYPLAERGAHVFVTMGDTKTTKTTAGEVCTVADIQLNNLLDSEVKDPTNYNLILVGGPCANKVVGMVSGFPTCEGWRGKYKTGEAIIQLADNGKNVAMLVAGTDAADTRAAAKVIAHYDNYKSDLKGDTAMVSGGKVTSAGSVKK